MTTQAFNLSCVFLTHDYACGLFVCTCVDIYPRSSWVFTDQWFNFFLCILDAWLRMWSVRLHLYGQSGHCNWLAVEWLFLCRFQIFSIVWWEVADVAIVSLWWFSLCGRGTCKISPQTRQNTNQNQRWMILKTQCNRYVVMGRVTVCTKSLIWCDVTVYSCLSSRISVCVFVNETFFMLCSIRFDLHSVSTT